MRTQRIVITDLASNIATDLASTIASLPSAMRITMRRMVLEPKSPGDYGSFENTQTGANDKLIEICPDAENLLLEASEGPQTSAPSEAEPLVANTVNLAYQSEPLLGGERGTTVINCKEKWNANHFPAYHPQASNPNLASLGGVVKLDIPPPSREEPRFPREKCKTFFAFLFLVFNMVLTTMSLALVHDRVPDRDKYAPLPDIVLDNVGEQWEWGLYASEILIMISSSSAFLVILFHKHRFIVMRRVFLVMGLLYLMRSITMFVTVMPMANDTYYCSPKANSTSVVLVLRRSFQLLSGFGLSINGHHSLCGDYMYSGHTVILVLCYLIIQEYTPRRCLLFHWLAILAAFAGMGLLLMAKAHYTVDVIVAYFVTTRLFWMYHQMSNNMEFKQLGPNNFLARVWWFPMFRYFEKNVKGVVPRQFEWPLSLPRRFFAKHPNRDS